MMSKSDAEREYQKELDRYRSQQVVIKALMAVKDDIEQIEPDMAESINVTYLSNDLKMDREGIDSLFGNLFLLFADGHCLSNTIDLSVVHYRHQSLIKIS